MTDTIFDDRARAFVDAREKLAEAEALKAAFIDSDLDGEVHEGDKLPADYHALIAEAGILATLATADVGVGLLAGGYAVAKAQAQEDRGAKRRRIRQTVAERIAAGREAAAKVTTHDHAVGRPPFAGGHTVRLTEGDWKGRVGQVLETHLSENNPTMLTVQLFPPGYPSDPSKPITLDVREDQAELVEL